MRKLIPALMVSAAMMAAPAFAAGQQQLDPIFQVTDSGSPPSSQCFNQPDNRNIFVRGATSVVGQTLIGGALGALIGNQIGGGRGKKIATGLGTAVGAAAGAHHAETAREARIQQCQQVQGYADAQNAAAGQYNQYSSSY